MEICKKRELFEMPETFWFLSKKNHGDDKMILPYEKAFSKKRRELSARKLGSSEIAEKAYGLFSRDLEVQGAPPDLAPLWFSRIVNRRFGDY